MNYAREILKAARRLLGADYVYDPDHDEKPSGGDWHRTDKGWSDVKEGEPENNANSPENNKKVRKNNTLSKDSNNVENKADGESGGTNESEPKPKKKRVISRGEISIKKLFGKNTTTLSDIYGEDSGVEILSESKFRKENKESYSMKNLYEIITGFTKKEASKLKNSAGFRTDFVIRSNSKNNDNILPFPIFIETDGVQHENGRRDEKSGFRFDLIDRVKDYVARTRHNGIAVRLRSEDQTGSQLKFVLGELKRYNDIITSEQPDVDQQERKSMIQEYADALSLGFAASDKREGNENSDVLGVNGHPRDYIKKLKRSIVKRIEVNNMDASDRKRNGIPSDYETRYPKLDATEKKMLKIMTSDYEVLDGSVYSPEDLVYSKHIGEVEHKSNYRFMRSIDLALKRNDFLSWKKEQRSMKREKIKLKEQAKSQSETGPEIQ